MSFTDLHAARESALIVAPAVVLGVAIIVLLIRRAHERDNARSRVALRQARERGSDKARLQHPSIDLSKCIGCGSCVRACPEDGVLSLMHGQAVVVHGARCVGHGLCAAACPAGAIALTLGDVSRRRDLPAITEALEAATVPGIFLAGEISGFALVRTAIAQGAGVADAVASRSRARCAAGALRGGPGGTAVVSEEPLDLLIVGAGPGGLSCALRARERGLNFVAIEQEPRLGGTVAAYPRRKMVMTQPVDLPLHGRLPKLTYQKEELVELWERLARESELPIRTGVRLIEVTRAPEGGFVAKTSQGEIRASHVCLALGRRGSPRKLGVPGEDLPKVAHSLIDAESYKGRRVLVVGGGDSAVEAALGLAEQPGNEVTISYRKKEFVRLKSRNEARVRRAIDTGRLTALFESEVLEITPSRAVLRLPDGVPHELPNDEVFVFIGGDPPFAILEKAGVSFDPKDRPAPAEVERGSGLLTALSLALVCAIVVSVWSMWFGAYYGVDPVLRGTMPMHDLLRPGGPVGLALGLTGCVLFLWNLTYLLRRSTRLGSWMPGSLRTWMGSHVFTGLFGVLCILVHAGFTLRPTVGGHAFLALSVVVLTGCIGRYLYAFVPRAANGTETTLDDLQHQLAALSGEWDRNGRGFGTRVREQIDALVAPDRWRSSFFARVRTLAVGQWRLRRAISHLRKEGVAEGIPASEIKGVLAMARRAHRLTLLVTHYEDVRAVLSSWRYFHRWLGLLMVLLTSVHIAIAAKYATLTLWPVAEPVKGAP
ncbi:Ferredoxin--NADP reductase [Phycisphaerales bacterium]|nr:Ferredoxin--NADP reductase [Phycisphaerales bacterium]